MTNKIFSTFISTLIAIFIITLFLGSFAGAEGINRYYLPDEGFNPSYVNFRVMPSNIGFDHFNRPIFSTAGIGGSITDGKIGILDVCTGNISYNYTYPNGTLNWSYDRNILTDSTGKQWLIKSEVLSELLVTDDGLISVGQEFNLPVQAGGSGPMHVFLNSDDTLWYVSRANSGFSSIYQTDLAGNTITSFLTSVGTIGGVVPDQSGNVWYGDMGTDEIVKFDTNTSTETRYNATMRLPIVEAISPNGKIWFSSVDRYVSNISADGSVVNVLFSGTAKNMITLGSDGYIWSAAEGIIAKINPTDDSYTTYNYTGTYGSSGTSIMESNNGSFFIAAEESTKQPGYLNGYTTSILQYYQGTNPNDCTAPTVVFNKATTITNAASANLTANTSDNVSVKKIKFYDSTDALLIDKSNPASSVTQSINVASFTDGTYEYSATVYDSSGNKAEATTNIVIDRTKPTASFTAPNSGDVLAGTTAVNVSASDTNGIESVQFRVNGVNTTKDTTAPYTYNLTTSNYPDGSYTITADVKDKAANVTTISRSVTIKNTPDPVEEEEEEVQGTTTVCHFPGTQGEFTLTVTDSALQSHINHGDYIGACITPDVEEITTEVNAQGKTVKTVQAGTDLSETDIEVEDEEILVVNGILGEVTVKPGATIKGNGRVSNLLVQKGAFLEPGESPGCLSAENLTLEGTYRFEASGSLACSGYDQARIKGSVTISGDLELTLDNYNPTKGTKFILIDNDDEDIVLGTFNNLSEGTTFEQDGITFQISYAGGDGNDVELEITEVPELTEENSASDSEESSYTGVFLLSMIGLAIIISLILIANSKKDSIDSK